MQRYFLILAAILFAPMTFAPLDHIVPIFPLSGSFEEKKSPDLTVSDFSSKRYQAALSTWADNRFPLRSVFIRFRNQIHRSVFHTIHARKIVEGTDGYYYENDHIAAYLGTDFQSKEGVAHIVRKAKRLQELLAKRKKTFLIVLAPGKGRIYPEHLPPSSPPYSEENYYNHLRREMNGQKVNYFDSIEHLKGLMKDDPLVFYPRMGTHWSVWAAAHVWREIVERTERLSRHPLPTFAFHLHEEANLPRQGTTDSDLFDSLNLLWSLPFGRYRYPAIDRETEKPASERPALLAIGDSFYQTFFAFGGPQHTFDPDRSEFRFYNKIVYPDNGGPSRKPEQAPLKSALDRSDVVILLVSEVNFKYFGYGFIEEAIESLER